MQAHAHANACTCKRTCTCIDEHANACTCTCKRTCTCIDEHANACTCTCKHMQAHTQILMVARMYTRLQHSYTHLEHTHTHTLNRCMFACMHARNTRTHSSGQSWYALFKGDHEGLHTTGTRADAGICDANEDPDAVGIRVEAMRTMESQQPGPDGARSVHRATQAHYSFTSQPSSATQQDLYALLLQFFAHKVFTNCSEQAVTDLLLRLRHAKCVDADVRANLPTSFKAMLTALHMFGFPNSDLWEYDMCPCSHIFR